MAGQLVLLATAVIAILGQTVASTCGALFSTDGTCQNDSTALLQVANALETFPFEKAVGSSNDDSDGPFGPTGPKYQRLVDMKDSVMSSMNDWHSSRDLAHVWGVKNVTVSPKRTVQIFSVVPVLGKDEAYIALLVECNGDAYKPQQRPWMQDVDTFVMFCAGPDGSHKTQVIARGHSWACPWPREEFQTKRFNIFLEDKNGTNLGMVVAEHDPELLGRERESVSYVCHLYAHKFGKNPQADSNLIVNLSDNPKKRLSWSGTSGSLPTFRTNGNRFYSIAREQWMTPRDRLSALGLPETPEASLSMGVPMLLVADDLRASSVAGNSFHFGNATTVQFVARSCYKIIR